MAPTVAIGVRGALVSRRVPALWLDWLVGLRRPRPGTRLRYARTQRPFGPMSVGRRVICAGVGLAFAAMIQWPLASSASAPAGARRDGAAIQIGPNGAYIIRGLDAVAHRIFVQDTDSGFLRQSDDWGVTFSGDKGYPPGLESVNKILRFRSKVYAVGRNAATGVVGVYSATPAAGDERLAWSGPTLKVSPPASVLQTDFNSDGHFLYVAEYGDPRPGPRLHRSADGIHWQTVFGPAKKIRHIHGVASDPYRAGQVWMTVGDGVNQSVWFSRKHGARDSWRVAVGATIWQSVQISFDRTWIYLAADANGTQSFYVIDRRTHEIRLGTRQYFQHIHPPGSPKGTLYLWNAYFGTVDPASGAYYFVANDDSGRGRRRGGSWQGFFAVRRVGGRVRILDAGGVARSMDGEVFVGGGRIWSGAWSVPALR